MPQTFGQVELLEPLPTESHTDFAIRFHESMRDAIPVTSERQRAMTNAWHAGNPDGDDLDRYAAAECPTEKYELVHNVSLFDEHQKKHASGKISNYGRDELASIVEKCNARIADSGNLPALTDGHTPDDMDQTKMPAVLGYCGPFRLGMVGNKKPRWAIFANEHWLSKYAHLKDERRTRSVEIECAPPISDRYFHSVAALGALAPQRDTGMVRYQLTDADKMRHDVEKYSCYGGAFTGMPSDSAVGGKRNSENYADGAPTSSGTPTMPQMGENDALQIASEVVQALSQQPWVQWAMRKAQEEMGGSGMDAAHGNGMPAPTPSSPPGHGAPPSQHAPMQQQPPAADPMSQGMDPDEQEIHAALPPHLKPKFAAKCGKGGSSSGSQHPPSQPQHAQQPQRYQADGEVEAEDPMSAFDTETESDPDSSPDTSGDTAVTQQSQSTIAPEKYALLERQNKDLTERLAKLEKNNRNVERYQRLFDLKHEGNFAYDPKAELADCDDMTDQQFERHVTKTIPEKYQRIGEGMPELFVEQSIEPRGVAERRSAPQPDISLDDRDEVVKYALRHGLDYDDAKAKVFEAREAKVNNNGKAKVA